MHARKTLHGKSSTEAEKVPETLECTANSQCSQRLHCLLTVRLYVDHLASQHPLSGSKRQAETRWFARVSRVIDTTRVPMCRVQRYWVWFVFPQVAPREQKRRPGRAGAALRGVVAVV